MFETINNTTSIHRNVDLSISPRNRELLILAVLLVLGLITRFAGIGFQSIWIDEGSTFYYSHYTWDQFKTADEPNSPFFYMLEGLMLDLFGQNEFGLRFASAVAGALTVPLAYMVSMKLFRSRPAALITSALFLLSPFCLYYGQEARGYIFVLFLFLIQILILLQALGTKNNWCWLLLAMVSALQFGMHYTGAIATLTLYLCAAYRCIREGVKKDRYRLPLQIVCSGILYLLLITPMLMLASDAGVTSPSVTDWSWCYEGMDYLINLLNEFLFDIGFSVVFFLLTLLGLYLCFKKDRDTTVMIIIMILFPLLLTTALSFSKNMTPRYVLFAVTGFYLIIPFFLTVIKPEVLMTKKAIVACAAVLIIMSVVFLPTYYTEVTKEDFRTGAKVLEENVREGDLVLYAVGSPNSVYASFSFYYDPVKDGIDTYGLFSNEDLWAYTDTFSYNNIYVLILADYKPLDYLSNVDSPDCECICEAYRITVFKITGPLPH